jgi:predicted choloylglycine hydrolase
MEGTSYDVGKMQGIMLKDDPEQYKFITSLPPGIHRKKYSTGAFRKVKDFFARYCPGINEEIRGTADALGVSDNDITYYCMAYSQVRQCSHVVVFPPLSTHVYAGHNYDLHPAFNDLRLCTTRVKGHYTHIGFSEDFFGRTEGINEQGLCITTSRSGDNWSGRDEGFLYHAVVRTVLDLCKTVDEALEIVQQVPMADCQNFIISDSSGGGALVEIAGVKRSVKKSDQNEEPFLCATNHFTLPEMIHVAKPRWHSVIRYKTLENRLKITHVKKDTIREILSDPMPKGVCCQHYASLLGTLWSTIFDVTDINVEICFGTPHKNTWHVFGLHDPVGLTTYMATLYNEPADPIIWKKMPPV